MDKACTWNAAAAAGTTACLAGGVNDLLVGGGVAVPACGVTGCMADLFLGNGLSVSGKSLFLVDSASLEDVATCSITHVYAMLQVQSQQKVTSNGAYLIINDYCIFFC